MYAGGPHTSRTDRYKASGYSIDGQPMLIRRTLSFHTSSLGVISYVRDCGQIDSHHHFLLHVSCQFTCIRNTSLGICRSCIIHLCITPHAMCTRIRHSRRERYDILTHRSRRIVLPHVCSISCASYTRSFINNIVCALT